MPSTLAGASVWEEELYSHLTNHASDEQATIERYRELAAGSDSETFRYLVTQIVDDEKRHHRWMGELAATIKSASDLSDPRCRRSTSAGRVPMSWPPRTSCCGSSAATGRRSSASSGTWPT